VDVCVRFIFIYPGIQKCEIHALKQYPLFSFSTRSPQSEMSGVWRFNGVSFLHFHSVITLLKKRIFSPFTRIDPLENQISNTSDVLNEHNIVIETNENRFRIYNLLGKILATCSIH